MKEFMFYIRNSGDAKAALSPGDHTAFIKKCEVYIEKLKKEGNLIAAQPLVRDGILLSKKSNSWDKVNVDPSGEVQVGYYHIRAEDLGEALEIAKSNPEFEFIPSARIEIHQVKTTEESTKYVYPK